LYAFLIVKVDPVLVAILITMHEVIKEIGTCRGEGNSEVNIVSLFILFPVWRRSGIPPP
jgi:hypothetical protein